MQAVLHSFLACAIMIKNRTAVLKLGGLDLETGETDQLQEIIGSLTRNQIILLLSFARKLEGASRDPIAGHNFQGKAV